MSEQNSSQEKTEEASEQKLKKSRDDGQVTRSKDVATTVSLLATLLLLKLSAELFLDGMQQASATRTSTSSRARSASMTCR